MKTYLIKDILAMKIAPIKDRSLRKLIWNGEKFKEGKYAGTDYVIATNIGTKERPRWAVSVEAVHDWMNRKKQMSSDKVGPN